jgi:hypothetical protein
MAIHAAGDLSLHPMEAWKAYFAENRRVPAGTRSGMRPA